MDYEGQPCFFLERDVLYSNCFIIKYLGAETCPWSLKGSVFNFNRNKAYKESKKLFQHNISCFEHYKHNPILLYCTVLNAKTEETEISKPGQMKPKVSADWNLDESHH